MEKKHTRNLDCLALFATRTQWNTINRTSHCRLLLSPPECVFYFHLRWGFCKINTCCVLWEDNGCFKRTEAALSCDRRWRRGWSCVSTVLRGK